MQPYASTRYYYHLYYEINRPDLDTWYPSKVFMMTMLKILVDIGLTPHSYQLPSTLSHLVNGYLLRQSTLYRVSWPTARDSSTLKSRMPVSDYPVDTHWQTHT